MMRISKTWTSIKSTVRRLHSDGGFTMIPAITAVATGSLLSLGAWAAANGDVNLQDRDRWSKVAYTKAQSGVTDYVQRMAEDSSYWQNCDQPSGTDDSDGIDHAINDTDIGSAGHLNRRWWPTPTNLAENTAQTGQYTIDLIPANGNSSCKANGNRAITMVDEQTGAIRVRVTGRAGPAVPNTPTINPDPANPNTFVPRTAASINEWRQKRWRHRSIVVEFRRRGFLDYAYFTDREGLEPTLYTNSTLRTQCATYWRTWGSTPGRHNYSCSEIQFADGDQIKGPFHTNDSVLLGSYSTTNGAKFGNDNKGDRIEVYDYGQGSQAYRTGSSTYYTSPARSGIGTQLLTGENAGYLDLPESNEDLATYADPNNGDPTQRGLTFYGTTKILLKNDGTIDINNANVNSNATTTYPVPTSGVIRVASTRSDCDLNISSGASYPFINNGCGLAEVRGTYNLPLTITSDADVVVTGNIIKDSGSPTAVLGLIGTHFVRVRHYYKSFNSCGNSSSQTGSDVTQIDAAILALTHSFMVDRHDCGDKLGASPNYYLTVNGVIAQKYRGPVGTGGGGSGGSGYIKNYSYDYRYRYLTPPHFLVPTLSTWKTSRSREQTPACACTG